MISVKKTSIDMQTKSLMLLEFCANIVNINCGQVHKKSSGRYFLRILNLHFSQNTMIHRPIRVSSLGLKLL